MRFIATWWAHRVNLTLTEPVTGQTQWRRVMDADQAEMVINQLEHDLEIARAGYALDQEIRGSSALKAENHQFAQMLERIVKDAEDVTLRPSLTHNKIQEIKELLANRLKIPPFPLQQIEEDLRTARIALKWIALGPTWGPGAPSLKEQAHKQSKCAQEALDKIEKKK